MPDLPEPVQLPCLWSSNQEPVTRAPSSIRASMVMEKWSLPVQRNRKQFITTTSTRALHPSWQPPLLSKPSPALAKVLGSLYTYIQYEPWHLQSNAVFIVLCPPAARDDDNHSLPRGSFHVSNHPRPASGFRPGSPSLRSVSFCGEGSLWASPPGWAGEPCVMNLCFP